MSATSSLRSSTVAVALVALAAGRASAKPAPIDDPTDEPAEPTNPPAPADDRDHDRDLDHDTAHGRDATTEPKRPGGDDPTDRMLVAPRLSRNAMSDIVVDTPGERSPTNIVVLAGMATVALAGGVFGLYYNLEGKKAANAVSSSHGFTGRFWTPADQAQFDKADRDRTRAIVLYSAGGAVLVAAAIALIASEPKSTRTVIHPHTASIAPVPGGLVVARGWTF